MILSDTDYFEIFVKIIPFFHSFADLDTLIHWVSRFEKMCFFSDHVRQLFVYRITGVAFEACFLFALHTNS